MTATVTGVAGINRGHGVLDQGEIHNLLACGLESWGLEGKRVVCVIPDGTRTAPMPLMYRSICDLLAGEVASLDWLIALGTHQPMSPEAISRHLEIDAPDVQSVLRHRVRNHAWADPATFVSLGEISSYDVEQLSDGRLSQAVPIRVNRLLLECDVAIVVGPVFPHEVVGFSGGNKYFFPGVSGPELIDVSHWLGALITASEIIGAPGTTPVRRLIDRAASVIPVERRCIAMVARSGDAALHGLYLGSCEDAWATAAEHSAEVHVTYVDQAYETVLSIVPPMYTDLWTAAKGVYKLETVVADGGELILQAPHVSSFSVTHGEAIIRAGYHCRDYFLAQPERFVGVPLGVLAHGTHVRGLGTYDVARGVEECRITVTLATAIEPELCEHVNLSWRDAESIEPGDWATREGVLVVPCAGETLYRLHPKTSCPTRP